MDTKKGDVIVSVAIVREGHLSKGASSENGQDEIDETADGGMPQDGGQAPEEHELLSSEEAAAEEESEVDEQTADEATSSADDE